MTSLSESPQSAVDKYPSHSKYRPDIDGLRAIAVLSVVAFHAFPSLFPGGFVGVDVFFVISGFLISTIIFSNLDSQSFSFSDFYARRVKRIFPALLVVLIACYAFGWFSLINHEFKELGGHIAGGAGFVSNLLLWSESGYFDSAAETKVLLHLWSLGIEEQFYIFWPLLMWAAFRKGLNLMTVVVLVGTISFVLNITGVNTNSEATFYSPQTRFWELLIGSGLAYLTLYQRAFFARLADWAGPYARAAVYAKGHRHTAENPALQIQSLIGAALIAAGFYTITEGVGFPGWWAILPTLGTALIISAGPGAWLNRAVLSNPALVSIGLISFPLYLWHWPLLTFVRIIADGVAPAWARAGAVLLSIVLAWLTFEFVEKKLRHRKGSKITSALVVAMLVTGLLGYVTYQAEGFPKRHVISNNDQSVRNDKNGKGPIIYCDSLVAPQTSAYCTKYENPNVAVLGDSHAEVLFYGIANSGVEGFERPITVGSSSCPPALHAELREGCDIPLKAGLHIIQSSDTIKYVILAAYSGFISTAASDQAKKYLDGYNRTIGEIRKSGKKIIIAMDNYTLNENSELCAPSPLAVRAAFKKYPKFCSELSFSDLKPHAEYNKFIMHLKEQNPDVILFNPEPYFCPNGNCSLFKDGNLLLNDNDHLSKYGSKLYIDSLLTEIKHMLQ